MKWTKYYVISEILTTFGAADANANLVVYELVTATTSATFHVNNTKLYVPVVTLSMNDNIKFLENIAKYLKE